MMRLLRHFLAVAVAVALLTVLAASSALAAETKTVYGLKDCNTSPSPPAPGGFCLITKSSFKILQGAKVYYTDAHVVDNVLKSPVTLIRGTLESALCNEENEKWRDSVGEAIEDLDRLLQLLNTTLDLAEAEAGALHIDRGPVDFSEVVRQLVDIYQPAMAEHDHEVTTELEEHVVVDADVTLLNRAVSNLLENELTHLPAGCRVKIRLRSHQGSAALVIEDDGPGFPPEIGSLAFKRFVKGKHSPGHGLGLAFVDAVAQAHGGCAQAADSPEGGAVITLLLPVSVLQGA